MIRKGVVKTWEISRIWYIRIRQRNWRKTICSFKFRTTAGIETIHYGCWLWKNKNFRYFILPFWLPYPLLLRSKWFDILSLLIRHPKRVFTYEMITELVWEEEYASFSRKAVNNHVSNLRQKLKVSPDVPDYIKSVYGIGYKLDY